MKRQFKFWLMSIPVLLAAGAGALWVVFEAARPARLALHPALAQTFQETLPPAFLETLRDPALWERPVEVTGDALQADLILQPWGRDSQAQASEWLALDEALLAPVYSSLRAEGRSDGILKAVPLFVDHVGLVLSPDLSRELIPEGQGLIPDLAGLTAALARRAGPEFFPLVLAGGNPERLAEAVSLFVLSLGGPETYLALAADLGPQADGAGLFRRSLEEGDLPAALTAQLRAWEASGVLHPEWLNFSEADTRRLVEAGRSSAVILRLSVQRTWPVNALRRWRALPFPPGQAGQAGQGLVAEVWRASIPQTSREIPRARATLARLLGLEFQNQAVFDLGLAPAASAAATRDREANDLRFWAAASRQHLPPLTRAADPAALRGWLGALREALGRPGY